MKNANYLNRGLERERLERIFNQPEQKQVKKSKVFSALNKRWQQLVAFLTEDINELQVWQTSDRCGNTWWHAYDPATGRSTSVDSETEMRVWIEERYYR